MTAKDKAKELFDKMYLVDDPMGNYPMCFDTAKQCALIAVDEIIKNQDNVIDIMRYKLILGGIKSITMQSDYWNNVKSYIEEL